MLDKYQSATEHTSTDALPQTLISTEKAFVVKSLWRRRSLQAASGVLVFGGVAFAFSSWPILNHLSGHITSLAYLLIFAPTGAAILASLFIFFVWWYLIDYGWLERIQELLQRGKEKRLKEDSLESQSHSLSVKQKGVYQPIASGDREKGANRRQLARHLPVTELQKRRKLQLYQGRQYLGSSRNSALPANFSLALPLALLEQPLALLEQKATFSDGEILPEGDEGEASLLAAAYLSSPGNNPSLTPVKAVLAQEQPSLIPISIYMLKEFIVEVRNKEGVKKTVTLQRKRRGDDRYTERDLFAFLAVLRGQRIGRLKLLESVFGYGLPNRNRQPEALRNQLNKATQFLRQDIGEVAATLGLSDLKLIGSGHDEWYLLTSECRVVDLDELDRHFAILDGISAQKAMEEPAQAACEALIKMYKGSFMENYIEDAVQAGSDEWDTNWMRQPYTDYLKKYLLAVWYRAEYWRLKGESLVPIDDTGLTLQRTYYETAAKLYEDYVSRAVPGFSDQASMAFALDIETIAAQAERALRSALDMYTATANTQAGEPVYQTFCKRMSDLWSFVVEDTDREWKPRQDTIEAWKNLKAQTKAHRKTGSVTPHDLPRDDVRRAR